MTELIEIPARCGKAAQVAKRDWLPPSRILVTGGTRGIGRAVVEALARREGVVVYLGCRDLAAGQAVAPHDGVVPVLLDVTDPASIKTAAETVRATGGLDAVVNNAGVMDESDMERTLEVNLDGVAAVTTAFAPLLRPGGRVINVSSGAGLRAAAALAPADREALEADSVAAIRATAQRLATTADIPVYGISKAAVNAYTKLAARTYPALRVNACSPGFCRTEIAGPNA